jgi:hypothetical protein
MWRCDLSDKWRGGGGGASLHRKGVKCCSGSDWPALCTATLDLSDAFSAKTGPLVGAHRLCRGCRGGDLWHTTCGLGYTGRDLGQTGHDLLGQMGRDLGQTGRDVGHTGRDLTDKPACAQVVSGMSGESEATLRELFANAKANAPALILIDEVPHTSRPFGLRAESRGRRAEGGKWRAESGGRKVEGRGGKAESRKRRLRTAAWIRKPSQPASSSRSRRPQP